MLTVPSDWAGLPFFSAGFEAVQSALALDERDALPPEPQVFAALEACAPKDVRVVILGQDPYPTPGHAHGFAFSVEPDVFPLPKSLNNILREMQDDIGAVPENGDLRFWATQRVLLLNDVLTVPAGAARGHRGIGWEALVPDVLAHLADRPRAFLLWGKDAQRHGDGLRAAGHFVLESPHPSPLSAYRGFFGARPFSRVNDWLREQGQTPIDWSGT